MNVSVKNGEFTDISRYTCVDKNGERQFSVADKVYIFGNYAVLIEEANKIDIHELNQLEKAIEVVENLDTVKCDEIKRIIGQRKVVAGIAHGLEGINLRVKLTLHYRERTKPIFISNCNKDLFNKLEIIKSKYSS